MKIVIIKKSGSLNDLDWKKDVDLQNIYKKAGFRKNKDFEKRNTWKIGDGEFVSVYAKNVGRANTENKYELPPPVDSDLYFGKLVIIKHSEETPIVENCEDLTLLEWKKIYEKLMGGFEDLDTEEEKSDEEYIAPEDLTQQGYKKDGFVVEDGDVEFNMGESDEEDEEEWVPSNNEENTDDSLEDTEEEEEEEEAISDKNEVDSEDEEEAEGDSSDNMHPLISGSDNELQEEFYEY